MENEAISLAWKTPIMPAPAFAAYHMGCFGDYQNCLYRHPVGYTETPSRVLVEDFALGTTCAGCGEQIGKAREKEEAGR